MEYNLYVCHPASETHHATWPRSSLSSASAPYARRPRRPAPFAAATPDALIDFVIGRGRREIAVIAYAGRQLWIKRDATSIHARDGASGQLLGKETCIGTLLAVIQRSLLPGGAFAWTDCPEVFHGGQSRLALAGE